MKTRIELRKSVSPAREIRARSGIEKRDITSAEKAAGYIGALAGEIPFNTDSGELRDRGLNRGKPFIERLSPEVFKRSLAEDSDIMGFAGHTDDPLAAFARIGENMTVTATDAALQYRALVPDTQAGRDLLSLVDKKIIRGTSFEFSIRNEGEKWEKRGDKDVRTITEARLYAVNPVAFPAYPDSEITAERGARRAVGERRGFWASADTYDPTLTADCAYAMDALAGEIEELGAAQEYLRANPTGAMADYATSTVADCAAEMATLIAWIAANGSTAARDYVARAGEKLAEARASSKPTEKLSATESDYDRERRFRILKLEAPENR